MVILKQPIISFKNVIKCYDDDVPVLKNVSFEIEEGKFYTLLGPSGCGKTTILRMIAGFSEPTEGDIYFEGEESTTSLQINDRLIRFFKTMHYFRTWTCMTILHLA